MNLKELYDSKKIKAEEAIKYIKSGDRISMPIGPGEPVSIVDALVANKENYTNVEVVQMLPMGESKLSQPGMEKHFKMNFFYAGVPVREAINSGRSDFTTCFFYEIPKLFETELLLDVALIQVSTPDEHGYCSFGVSVDYTKKASEAAKIVIAEVNEQMPRTLGDTFIHISDIDYIVEASYPLLELKPPIIGDVERQIGKYCASLIEDGDTIQVGIGSIPDAVLLSLKDKRDLGVHSEMISDGILELIKAGVITNKDKIFHKGKCVFTFLMGTKKLYDFVDNNPMIEMYPVDYTNDPRIIMQNNSMVSINSCIQVDFLGQVVSECLGNKQISGVGGQVDFVRGATMGMDGKGKSIIAMPSTAVHGKVSRIVCNVDEGAAITTSRNDVDYIVTEYGIAKLKGKTIKKRAKELIRIAHPNFRQKLISEYKQRFNCKF